MKTIGFAILAFLAAIFSHCSMATPINRNENFVEKSKDSLVPHIRAKRSPGFSLEGEGTGKSGYIKPGYSGTIYDDGKTRIDASGSIKENYQKGFPHRETYNVEGRITHNVYKGKGAEIDVYGGYDKTFSGGYQSGSYNAGTHITF